ncbi:adenylyltransferase/cytidyltransferase family protein [bacterium]|jgi:D-glycero-beta-D-manno-heptose 1-phosphate adenylyltransferase|nr:adenylyltransferase/cytidyltransferase family protein [bacterium]MBT4251014.1 adenylyltransferase/cytidyltransferase family protein [bacterium]MBT4597754.1 adenylyltransferase/cytidyltransferase family protein [bacterium]MBT6753849.1 adenylyltransferase/cytidyltransferase family protein [bacterium]MBT7037439.1 adenylyltransferase/cytidyltransferase family protein [bacterium]
MKEQGKIDSVCKFDAEKTFGSKQIADYTALKNAAKHCRDMGLRIVLTQGSWDLLHIGHARYMANAKGHGDVLIVGVDSDAKVRKRKGPDRPVVPEAERMEMIEHLKSVDLVVLKELNVPKWELIRIVKPDTLIATAETYTPKKLEAVKKLCGDVVVLDPQATTSTSAKIRRLQITTANKIENSLRPKLIATIEEVLSDIKGKAGKK